MAKPLSYWEKRKAREAYEMYEEVERAALELNKIYASVSDQIERDARRIFRRFEIKFGLSEGEAEKLLNTVLDPKDIKTITGLLRRDPKNKELVAQLESQAYASRINRLVKMQDRVDEISTQILGKAEPAFDATLSEVARGSYYREIFGMQQRANAAFAFSPLTVDRISKVLAANWSGKSYSKRLWDNTEALSASVKRELMKGLLMGKSPFRMSQTIEEEFHKGATASRRLMRTEATYVANQMAMEAYKEAGTEKYIYVAILDMRTSEICQSLDKKRFLISSAEVGENYPPMHPWCRSTTIAWMPDEMLKALKQSAIDPATGERIEVPGDMTYQEWYKRFVEGVSEPEAPQTLPRDLLVFAPEQSEVSYAKYTHDEKIYPVEYYKSGGQLYSNIGNTLRPSKGSDDFYVLDVQALQNKIDTINEDFAKQPFKNAFIEYNGTQKGDTYRDATSWLYQKLGATGLPQELDKTRTYSFVSPHSGGASTPVLYRGVGGNPGRRNLKTSKTMTPTEMANQYAKGSPFISTGIYGDGLAYGTPYREVPARFYAGPEGAVFPFALDKESRIIDFIDADQIYRKVRNLVDDEILRDPFGLTDNINCSEATISGRQARRGAMGRLMNMLGFDSIAANNGDNLNEVFVSVLNRQSTMVRRIDAEGNIIKGHGYIALDAPEYVWK